MTEQEAEFNLMSEISDEMSGGVPGRETRIPECLTAYRAAVRAETLREVRAKVEESETPPLTNLAPAALRVAFNDGWRAHTQAVLHSVLPALAQPEGTA